MKLRRTKKYIIARKADEIGKVLQKDGYLIDIKKIRNYTYIISAKNAFGLMYNTMLKPFQNIETQVELVPIDENNTQIILMNPLRIDIKILLLMFILFVTCAITVRAWQFLLIALITFPVVILWFNFFQKGQEDMLNAKFINLITNEY